MEFDYFWEVGLSVLNKTACTLSESLEADKLMYYLSFIKLVI